MNALEKPDIITELRRAISEDEKVIRFLMAENASLKTKIGELSKENAVLLQMINQNRQYHVSPECLTPSYSESGIGWHAQGQGAARERSVSLSSECSYLPRKRGSREYEMDAERAQENKQELLGYIRQYRTSLMQNSAAFDTAGIEKDLSNLERSLSNMAASVVKRSSVSPDVMDIAFSGKKEAKKVDVPEIKIQDMSFDDLNVDDDKQEDSKILEAFQFFTDQFID
ncbi:hypothetical protein ROZALSC1DRAFT_28399 [Rozella allomycis CSF55]|uniref:Uncharacterized protein n=1 Tax=Rozella allomycis (strain CSF55) TaxID=988480 RepID=A0A075B0G1_ROZAC|nr:hypothetical protein O9G_004150 [Rozella allomycis CSF55]RKP20080.1 hypothetical protein ROZALSC1DRAFT_28399 [Rozella allomycis CSF55]|eukprot:EPZ35865.1 hypothetical protein O9G_004150 [Rozella allomycis CSF55]